MSYSESYVKWSRSFCVGPTSSTFFSRFTLTGTSARQWSILVGEEKEVEVWLESSVQVSMIECSSRRLPPTGCLQYLTGPTGTVTSFNYRAGCTSHPCTHLQSHQYTVWNFANYKYRGHFLAPRIKPIKPERFKVAYRNQDRRTE